MTTSESTNTTYGVVDAREPGVAGAARPEVHGQGSRWRAVGPATAATAPVDRRIIDDDDRQGSAAARQQAVELPWPVADRNDRCREREVDGGQRLDDRVRHPHRQQMLGERAARVVAHRDLSAPQAAQRARLEPRDAGGGASDESGTAVEDPGMAVQAHGEPVGQRGAADAVGRGADLTTPPR